MTPALGVDVSHVAVRHPSLTPMSVNRHPCSPPAAPHCPRRNNNAGGVARTLAGGRLDHGAGLGAINEDDEEEEGTEEGEDGSFYDDDDYDDDDGYGGGYGGGGGGVDPQHVPQCFSHFTHTVTDGKKLVCDLQVGGWL